jgi:hypothetical protein
MKTFREFMIITEKAEIPKTPEQIRVIRARQAAAAQTVAQNATNPGERAAAAAATERLRTASGETIRGNNPSSQSQPGSTVNSSSTAQPQSSQRAPQTYSNQGVGRQDNIRSTQTPNAQTPNASWKSRVPQPLRNVARGGNRAIGGLGVLGAADAARQGDVAGAVEQGLLAGQSSRRVKQAVSRTGLRAVQGAASRLGVKGAAQIGARFIPGLSTAYGVARGTSALNRGDYLGAALGYGSAIPVVGGVAAAADIARDVIDDPNERYKRIATSGVRSARQVAAKANTYGANKGSALTGIGGPTSVSQNKDGTGFMSTGSGLQRKTVQLAKTQLVKDPTTGKQRVGDLAYKGGKAVYLARPSAASSDTNLLSRLSRATGIGGQRERDSAAAKKDYRTALKNTQTYQKKLGITPKPVVGPKIVGPKIVGPKIVGAKPQPPAGGGMGGQRGGRA